MCYIYHSSFPKRKGDPNKFCVKKNKVLPIRQDLRKEKI